MGKTEPEPAVSLREAIRRAPDESAGDPGEALWAVLPAIRRMVNEGLALNVTDELLECRPPLEPVEEDQWPDVLEDALIELVGVEAESWRRQRASSLSPRRGKPRFAVSRVDAATWGPS